jgi:membrane protein DedA with SNARE-associated domain
VFGAGYAFTLALDSTWSGALAALFCCFLGSCIGAVIAFLRSRYMMRDLIYLFCRRYPLVRAADRALKNDGFRIMLMLRLCPLIPFNGLNYCCGVTGVSLHDFAASLVGILPFHVYTIMLGATAGVLEQNLRNSHPSERQRYGFIALLATGAVFGLFAMAYSWRVVKRELQRELDLTSEEFDSLIHPAGSDMSSSSSLATVHDGLYVSDRTCSMASQDYLSYLEQQGPMDVAPSSAATTGNGKDTITNDQHRPNNQHHRHTFSLNDEGEEWYWIWT